MKPVLSKTLHGIAAAFTTPDAVKKEKSFAAFAITRVIIAVGGTGATAVFAVDVVNKLFS